MKKDYFDTLYSGDIMKMIGEQAVPDKTAREGIEQIINAHLTAGDANVYSIAIDCFLLGTIQEKRRGRAEKAAKTAS